MKKDALLTMGLTEELAEKAAEMLIRHIGLTEKADKLDEALLLCQKEGKIKVTGRSDGATGDEYAEYVLSKLH